MGRREPRYEPKKTGLTISFDDGDLLDLMTFFN